MAEAEEDGADENRSKWSGYADYQEVASQLHKDINRAVDAYAHIDSKRSQGVGITPQTAVNTRQSILKITKRLHYEIKRNNHIGPFDDIDDRWSGDDGYVRQLENASFIDGGPDWLGQLMDDIIQVGWELGYLKAGVEKPSQPNSEEQQAKEMFK